jgi:hypothetical protein
MRPSAVNRHFPDSVGARPFRPDVVTGAKAAATAGAQVAADAGSALHQLAVAPRIAPVADRRPVRQPSRDLEQQYREVHATAPSLYRFDDPHMPHDAETVAPTLTEDISLDVFEMVSAGGDGWMIC